MHPVVPHPTRHGALEGERTRDRQRDLQGSAGDVGVVREEAVVAGAQAQHGDEVHPGEQRDMEPADVTTPQRRQCDQRTEERADDDEQGEEDGERGQPLWLRELRGAG